MSYEEGLLFAQSHGFPFIAATDVLDVAIPNNEESHG
jgi:hypothetical protein